MLAMVMVALGCMGMGGSLPSNTAAPETLYGATWSDAGLTLQVFSGGCTSAADFRITRSEAGLTVQRTKEDLCEAYFEDGVAVSFGWAELPLSAEEAPLPILNKVQAPKK